MMSSLGDGFVKELLIISSLVSVQMIYAVYMVFLNRILAMGLNPLFLVIFGNLVTSIFLLPFALVLERKKWPARLSPVLMAQFGLLSLGGVAVFQYLMLLGVKMASPAIASAMPNIAPGFIFIIAVCLRFEKFEIRCKYTRAKVLGTLVCLGGAIGMSFLQSPSASPDLASQDYKLDGTFYQNWIIGCLCLLSAVAILSCITVLQAATMVNFPAPLSLCSITSLMGSILTALLLIITKGKLDVGSIAISFTGIIVIVLAVGGATGVCAAIQTWCINQKGPVLVSIFNPTQTVFSAALSAIILRQFLSLGSLAGMLLMFIGLYIVLWAKKKEDCSLLVVEDSASLPIHNVERPLLS